MNNFKRGFGLAVWTLVRFFNNTSSKIAFLKVITNRAFESSFFHFWINITTSDDNSFDLDQTVDFFGTKISHSGVF